MKLIYHDGTVGAIYFPVGKLKDGGSCQFATKKCIKECGLESNELIEEVYKFFKEQPVGLIVEQILKDFYYFPNKVLTWFASGDCPSTLTTKILGIMKALLSQNIIQNGFTRNKRLWYRAINEFEYSHNKVRLCLTLNSKKEAQETKGEGLVAVPDYACWKVTIYGVYGEHEYGKGREVFVDGCGGGWVMIYNKRMSREIISEEDCGICYNKRIGCFSN